MKMFMVGGAVRDEILGVKSKDIDFSVVLDQSPVWIGPDPFQYMIDELTEMGFDIFLQKPEFLTITARFPIGHLHDHMTADFVLARKESDYTDGRRPDRVVPGTLLDDLKRRDFTMNAIAKDEHGHFIDPFDGRQDISHRIIRAVGDPVERLREDALRAVRAIRFAVTKDFTIDSDLKNAMETREVELALMSNISDERISDELSKMFRFNTLASLRILDEFIGLRRAIFHSGRISLDSTMKTRGRGK